MIKTNEDISTTKKRLGIEVPAEAMEAEIQKSLRSLRGKVKIPGFRPGKVPMAMLEKRFGKEVESEVLEKIVSQYYSEAIKETGIKPIAHPELEGEMKFNRGEALSLTFTVEIRPEIAELKYEGLEVDELPSDITEEDINSTLERIQQDKATYEPCDDAAEDGDLIIMDYTITDEENAENTKELKDEVFKIGIDTLPKEFSTKLTGKKKSGKATFKTTFDEGYYDKEFAGKKCSIKLNVKEVKKEMLPAVDDELAKDLEFDNLDTLKGHIREQLAESKANGVKKLYKASLITKLIDAHEFDPPESLIKAETENMLAHERAQLGMMKKPEEGEDGPNIDEAKLTEENLPEATRRARATILIQEIGEKEKVEVSEEDMQKHVVELSQQINLSPENVIKYYVSKDGSLEGLKHQIFEDKVIEVILDMAKIVKGTGSKGDEEKKPKKAKKATKAKESKKAEEK